MKIRDLNICVIDDDPIFVYTVKKIFEINKIEKVFDSYENGEVAYNNILQKLQSDTSYYDLILLDLNMPVWDGWDFLEEFQRLNLEHYPTILISSSTVNPDDIKKAQEYDLVKGFVGKPFTIEKLSSELHIEV